MPLGTFLKLHWDRAVAVVLAVIGAMLVITGWAGISGTPYAAEQLPYIMSSGVGGLFLLGAGATLWLSADLRDEWRKLDSVDEALRALGREPEEGVDGIVDIEGAAPAASDRMPDQHRGRSLAAVSGSAEVDGR